MAKSELPEEAYRIPDGRELGILLKLLDTCFSGAVEIRHQLPSLVVRRIAEDGTLELKVLGGAPVPMKWKTPAEGRYIDEDGIGVSVMLHLSDDGLPSMLEVIKDDQSPLQTEPTADSMAVF